MSDRKGWRPAVEKAGYLIDDVGGNVWLALLSYRSTVFGGHPTVDTHTQCLLESFRIQIPSLAIISHPPVSTHVVGCSPPMLETAS